MSDGIAMVKMLLGLPGMDVLEVVEGDNELVVKVETTETIGWCPGCGVRAQSQNPAWWGATCEIRMNPTEPVGVNRGEHLRALPPDDERYPEFYNRRQMAESVNSWIKAQVPSRRARTYGQDNQHIDLLFIALSRNTQSELHYRDRNSHAPPGTAAA